MVMMLYYYQRQKKSFFTIDYYYVLNYYYEFVVAWQVNCQIAHIFMLTKLFRKYVLVNSFFSLLLLNKLLLCSPLLLFFSRDLQKMHSVLNLIRRHCIFELVGILIQL